MFSFWCSSLRSFWRVPFFLLVCSAVEFIVKFLAFAFICFFWCSSLRFCVCVSVLSNNKSNIYVLCFFMMFYINAFYICLRCSISMRYLVRWKLLWICWRLRLLFFPKVILFSEINYVKFYFTLCMFAACFVQRQYVVRWCAAYTSKVTLSSGLGCCFCVVLLGFFQVTSYASRLNKCRCLCVLYFI